MSPDIAKCSLGGKTHTPPPTLRTTDTDETHSLLPGSTEAGSVFMGERDTDPGRVGTQCLQTKSYCRTPSVTDS